MPHGNPKAATTSRDERFFSSVYFFFPSALVYHLRRMPLPQPPLPSLPIPNASMPLYCGSGLVGIILLRAEENEKNGIDDFDKCPVSMNPFVWWWWHNGDAADYRQHQGGWVLWVWCVCAYVWLHLLGYTSIRAVRAFNKTMAHGHVIFATRLIPIEVRLYPSYSMFIGIEW